MRESAETLRVEYTLTRYDFADAAVRFYEQARHAPDDDEPKILPADRKPEERRVHISLTLDALTDAFTRTPPSIISRQRLSAGTRRPMRNILPAHRPP